MATVVGARCSTDPHGLYYVAFNATDPANAAIGGATGGSSSSSMGSAASSALLLISAMPGGITMLVDTRVWPIPRTPANLWPSSTGLPALAGLTADVNVQARIAAMNGTIMPAFRAAAAAGGYGAVTVNTAAIAADFAAIAAAWSVVVGNATVAAGKVGVASVAYAPPSTHSGPPYLWWLPLPLAFGSLLGLFVVGAYLVTSNGIATTPAGIMSAVLSGAWWPRQADSVTLQGSLAGAPPAAESANAKPLAAP